LVWYPVSTDPDKTSYTLSVYNHIVTRSSRMLRAS